MRYCFENKHEQQTVSTALLGLLGLLDPPLNK